MDDPATVSGKRNRRLAYVLLLAVLILGGVLRVGNITRQGLLDHDEASYLLEAQFISSSYNYVRSHWQVLKSEGISNPKLDDEINNLEGLHLNTAKPGHTVLIWLMSRVVGFRDYAPLLVAGVFGLLTVLMVFVLGRRFYGLWPGLLGAGVLAVSEYHVIFSRSGLAEADSSFFFVPAVLFYYLSRQGQRRKTMLALAGLSVGLGYVSNWRWDLLPLIFVFYEIQLYLFERQVPPAEKGVRFLVLAMSMAVPLLLAEVPYRLFLLVGGKVSYYPFTYFEQLAERHRRYSGTFNLHNSFDYIRYLWTFDGALIFSLIAIGLLLVLRQLARRENFTANFVVLGQFLIPLIFWSIYSSYGVRFPRSLVTVLPAAALLAGVGGTSVARWASSALAQTRAGLGPAAIGTALLLAVLVLGSARSWDLLSMRSGYKQAAAIAADYSLKTGKPVMADLGLWPLWKYYAQDAAKERGVPLERLMEYRVEGATSGLIPIAFDNYLGADQERLSFFKRVQGGVRPVLSVPNYVGAPTLYLARMRGGRVGQIQPEPDVGLIQVYDVP